jgi:hypothetical protein
MRWNELQSTSYNRLNNHNMILDRCRTAQFCGPPPITDLMVQVCGIASATLRLACLTVRTIQHQQDKGTSDNEPCIVLHLPSPPTPASLHPHKHARIQEAKVYQPTDPPGYPTHPTQHASPAPHRLPVFVPIPQNPHQIHQSPASLPPYRRIPASTVPPNASILSTNLLRSSSCTRI